MDRPTVPAIYFVMLLAIGALLGACGTYVDTTPPTSTLTDPPNYIFMNGSGETVTFRGTASDDTVGIKVEISFDNKANWTTAADKPLLSRFDWSYAATAGELPSGGPVIWTRATDNDGNAEDPQLWSTATVSISSSPTVLKNFYAAAGTVLYRSGSGGAYGTSAAGPVLANTKDLMVVGSGYGTALTADGFSAVDATPQTALATSSGSSYIFSIGSDLTLKDLRISGGGIGVKASTATALELTVQDSVFTGQLQWAVSAMDAGGSTGDVNVNLYGTMVDASSGTGSNHGGVYLKGAVYDIYDSMIRGNELPSGSGGGMFAESGSGVIDSTVFFENAPAIWISGASSVISGNVINGNLASNTRGINITTGGGSPETPDIRFNDIFDNAGYGVRIEGGTAPVFFHNVITGNTGSGFILDGDFNQTPLPDLGNYLVPNSSGFNSIIGNSFLDQSLSTNNVFVTGGSSPGTITIPAQNNFWEYFTESSIKAFIIDGDDTAFGFNRPIINVFSPEGSNPNPGRP
ncbi:MAG: hypothetical protein GXP52_01755 [Deltaproteobacteria bacterium]|nr:hypothetical protein [Deltaproteobacteria bacterium]